MASMSHCHIFVKLHIKDIELRTFTCYKDFFLCMNFGIFYILLPWTRGLTPLCKWYQAMILRFDLLVSLILINLAVSLGISLNLKLIFEHLEAGIPIKIVGHGLKSEPKDIFRIAHSKKGELESRMYLYFAIEDEKVVLLTAGTKSRQGDDIALAIKIKEHYLTTTQINQYLKIRWVWR